MSKKVALKVKYDYVTLVLLFVAFTVTTLIVITEDKIEDFSFGAEYGNIASSIVNGEGFSGVFREGGGPTAWHPPFIVSIYAIVFSVFGIKTSAAMWALLVLRALALTITGYLLLKIVDQTNFVGYRYLVIVIFILQVILNETLHKTVEDVSFTILLFTYALYGLIAFFRRQKGSSRHIFILACLLPLSMPSMALAFAMVLFIYFIKRFIKEAKKGNHAISIVRNSRQLKKILIAGLIFCGALLLWSTRNYLEFEKFIPIKSNLWFEFYLTNNQYSDGLLSFAKTDLDHPYKDPGLVKEYESLGEIDFIEKRKVLAQAFVKKEPWNYIKNIINRLVNAFVWTGRPGDVQLADMNNFSQADLQQLYEHRLLTGKRWVSFSLRKKKFLEKINQLELTNQEAVISDWLAKREDLNSKRYSLRNLIIGFSLALVPFVCLVGGLFIKELRTEPSFKLVASIYFFYLTPYIVVSHYLRYQLFLMGIHTILFFLIASFVLSRIRKSSKLTEGQKPVENET